MDRAKLNMVKDAEFYLAAALAYIKELEQQVQGCTDKVKKRKLENLLEQDRIRFSQMMTDVVLFKANHGIFTDPEDLKKIK